MEYKHIFVILVCIAIIYKYFETKSFEVTYVKSKSGQEYLVRNLNDKQQASNTLDEINQRFQKIINYCKTQDKLKLFKQFVIKEPQLKKLNNTQNTHFLTFKKNIQRLINNYNPNSLSENVPNSIYTSYSENKGQKIVFCMRNKRTNKLVDINTMMFVGLHELAHLMTYSVGHKPEFWDNFRIILRISIRLSIYSCINYNIESKDYCGTKINDSPLKCTDI